MNEIQSINQQMALISNLARAYYNATPEQRANISLEDMQEQINRYNELKARRNELYAEQEARVQEELLAQRRAAEERAAINSRWTWRRINKNDVVPETQVIQPTKPINVVVTEQWEVVPVTEVTSNDDWNYYIGPITWMRIRKPFTIGWRPVGNYNTSNSIIPEWVISQNNSFEIIPLQEWDYIPFPYGTFGTWAWADYTWAISMWSWNNITPVNINPTNEQFRISQVINWHTYEYWDNGSVKIDWVLQRAGNGTDYIIRDVPTTWYVNTFLNNTWVNNTWVNNTWFNRTWGNVLLSWFKY